MKIYDCFPFYNELDLLELRLTELYDHVDYFVIVEGSTTFTNLPKPYYFEEHKDRYAKWMDKIIHVKVDDMPRHSDAWVNDIYQRNQINRGIVDAHDDDIIIVSDLDEILRPSAVDSLRGDVDTNLWAFRMPLFNFKFNYMMVTADKYAVWAMATRKRYMVPADELRFQRFQMVGFPYGYSGNQVRLVEHGGWQWTYFGDRDFAVNKIKSFAHTESNIPSIVDNIDIDRSISQGDGVTSNPEYRFSAVKVDEYFPQTIRENLEKYSTHIISGASHTVKDFLPFC